MDAHHAGGRSGASLPSRGHGGVEYVEAGGAKENSGAPWPAAPGPAAAASNGDALFLDYCNSLSSLGEVQLALMNLGVHVPELIEFPKKMGHHFSKGQILATNAWQCVRTGHTSATGHFNILGGSRLLRLE